MSLEDKLNEFADEAIGTGAKVVQGKAGIEELIKFTAALKGASAVLGIFGESTKGARNELDGMQKAFVNLYEISKTETAIMTSFSDLLKGDLSKSLQGMTSLLKGATDQAQTFQVSLVKYGQDLSFQNSIREQAYALSSLGIKYDDLKKANLDLVEKYNASIRISDSQSKSFDRNRESLSQLIVFNEKFGITTDKTNQLINFTKNVMGGGTEQAVKFSEQLQKFADVTGQKAGKVFEDFTKELDRFSVMSSTNAITQFEKLQATAARTGQDIIKVFDSVAKFDEIDKGFEAGGQLNRVLSFMGGSFDTFSAIQADDAERARMIYESISSVADKYGQLTNDVSKRNMAKQIADASGVDMKTVVGLLNKSTDLGKDIAEIGKMPLVTEGFTDKERSDKMIQLSTSKDFANAVDGLIEAGKATQILAQNLRQSSSLRTGQETQILKILDKEVLTPILTAQSVDIKKSFGDIGTTIRTAFEKPSETLNNASAGFSSAVAEFRRIINTKPNTAKYSIPPEKNYSSAETMSMVPTEE